MLTEKDLVYFGAILIWQSPAFNGSKDDAIKAAQEVYYKIFK
jgi:hypothetical protein